MAPTSSKSGTRDKDKAVRGMAGARDVAESRARSGHLRRCLEAPQITNTYNITFNNEVHFAEGGGVFPSPPGEGSRPSRPRRTLPASPNIHAETSRAPRPANDVEEIGEVIGEVTEEEESSRNDSGEDELPEPPVAHSTSPTSTERVTRWQQHDSAYGSRRGSKEKHEAYRAKMINGSLNRHSAVEGSSQWKRKARAPSAGSNFEEAATGDGETQRETGGDEDREEGGDNGDESGDVRYQLFPPLAEP
jgi:hypothetical protein